MEGAEIAEQETLSILFRGILPVAGPSPVAITGLRGRCNERQDFLISMLPVFPPAGVPGDFFPHLADGGGYLIQIVLIDPDNGVATFGNVRFFDTAGQPRSLKSGRRLADADGHGLLRKRPR